MIAWRRPEVDTTDLYGVIYDDNGTFIVYFEDFNVDGRYMTRTTSMTEAAKLFREGTVRDFGGFEAIDQLVADTEYSRRNVKASLLAAPAAIFRAVSGWTVLV